MSETIHQGLNQFYRMYAATVYAQMIYNDVEKEEQLQQENVQSKSKIIIGRKFFIDADKSFPKRR